MSNKKSIRENRDISVVARTSFRVQTRNAKRSDFKLYRPR